MAIIQFKPGCQATTSNLKLLYLPILGQSIEYIYLPQIKLDSSLIDNELINKSHYVHEYSRTREPGKLIGGLTTNDVDRAFDALTKQINNKKSEHEAHHNWTMITSILAFACVNASCYFWVRKIRKAKQVS